MNTTSKWLAIVAVAFVSGSFLASPELRAFAANTVFSTDIVDGEVKTADLGSNSVTAAKIKDNEVKAAEIATDAVGAAELQGVTKLLFGQCVPTDPQKTNPIPAASTIAVTCSISGVDTDDSASAEFNNSNLCFRVSAAYPGNNQVNVYVRNDCAAPATLGASTTLAVIVYDK